jgi:hypothetical protein
MQSESAACNFLWSWIMAVLCNQFFAVDFAYKPGLGVWMCGLSVMLPYTAVFVFEAEMA